MNMVSPRPVPSFAYLVLSLFIDGLQCRIEVYAPAGLDRDVFLADRRYHLCTILGRGSYGTVAQVMDKGSGK